MDKNNFHYSVFSIVIIQKLQTVKVFVVMGSYNTSEIIHLEK